MSAQKKKIRQNFRDTVFKRDGYICRFCNETADLDAHHITDRTLMPHGGYVKENGISLCPSHHMDAEVWHTSEGREHVAGMSPSDLYKVIRSSYELACKKSQELKR